jgi:hypothetical protein
MFSFISNMAVLKFNIILLFLTIGYIDQGIEINLVLEIKSTFF